MAAPAYDRWYSPEEYLAHERAADYRSEYIDGEIFAMTGASREHSLVNGNVFGFLHTQLRDTQCEIHMIDMRVKVSARGTYTYPDTVVVCGEPQFEDREVDTLLNPTVIIEVLSPSTEAYDRGGKFERYTVLPSLREYLLIAQDRPLIEHFVREKSGWLLTFYRDLADVISLPSIGCELPLAEVYRKITFKQPGTEDKSDTE